VEKYSTFFGKGLRAPQEGRQNTPVVFTPRRKIPSYVASLRRYARSISVVVGSCGMMDPFVRKVDRFLYERIMHPAVEFHRKMDADILDPWWTNRKEYTKNQTDFKIFQAEDRNQSIAKKTRRRCSL
jgi:hypothetical protein